MKSSEVRYESGISQKWCAAILENPIQGHCLKDDEGVYSPVGLLESIVGEVYTFDEYHQCYANTERSHLMPTKATLKAVKAKTDLSKIDDMVKSCHFKLGDPSAEKYINFPFLLDLDHNHDKEQWDANLRNRQDIARFIAENYAAL